ncbi:TonB-dependent receptor [Sphingomonas sp. ABOLD]|uniref:TonB-dependent receptor n=1 Tax=Sphingomonas TaxID=13687 RepID=UPI000F7E20F3|nr:MULTISPECIES: TonB-dependent receptor [Sphingomonas]RSV40625.1 TonB-dependent receptor [Sphingomonas sp. ABOLE]RSV48515.1 TonB-dependent receptor [Sphingomonas sp. ABOLD]
MKSVSRSTIWSRSASMMAVAACMVLPTIAQAQTDNVANAAVPQESGQGEEIVVTGIRASLERAIAIKRESPGIVDAISAEDIGKFPDTNLAESLQRVPGVSINRTNGEGSLVTVRGFGPNFNLVTLNGRQLAAANVAVVGGDQNSDGAQGTTRSFDFSNLATEGVRTLEVYKTGRAAVPSGGIGATINVVTRRPLDNGTAGLSGSVGAKAVYDTSVDGCLDCGSKVTPEFSGVLSWSDPEQRLGFNLFGSYQKRNFTSISATSNDWNIIPYSTFLTGGFARSGGACTGAATPTCTVVKNAPTNPNQLVAIPNDSRYHYAEGSRERINGQATVQFKPTDTLTLTADALYAQNKQREERSDVSNWFSRPFDEVTFDGNTTVATATYLHETLGGQKDEGFEAQSRAQKSKIEDYGLNAKWEISPTFSLNLDGHISSASSRPDNPNGVSSTLMGMGANVVAAHSVTYLSGIPQQDITLGASAPLDINDVGSSIGRTRSSIQNQKVKEVRADFGWDLGEGSRFDFGGNFRKVETTQTYTETQQTLGDWGLANPGDVQRQAPGALQAFCLVCKFEHYNPGSDPDSRLAFRGNGAAIYSIMSPYYASRGNAVAVNSRNDNRVNEEIWAAYGQLTWKGEIGNAPARLVGGLRYEHTKSHTTSLTAVPAGIEWDSDNDFTVVLSNQGQYLSDGGSYDNILPQVDFQVELQRNLLARLSYSKTIARPNYNNLYTSVTVGGPPRPSINGGIPTGNTGNARLRPLISDNFDASLEWYFKPDSYVSASFFDKRVRNFIGNGQYTSPLFGLRDPTSAVAGSRSGAARDALQGIGADTSDVNLYVMTSLIQSTGSTAAAVQQFNANYNATARALDEAFIQSINNGPRIQANGTDALWQFQVTQPINNRDAEIYGVELAGQYFLGTTGFGVAAQYTLVRGNIGFNIGADPSQDQFALVGLSDTASGTLIYDKNGISARLAYNWRGKSLSGVNRQGSRNPEFTAPFGQLDMNISYEITPQIAITFEGINLTEESVRTYARDEKQLWFAQELDRRFLLGARFKF